MKNLFLAARKIQQQKTHHCLQELLVSQKVSFVRADCLQLTYRRYFINEK